MSIGEDSFDEERQRRCRAGDPRLIEAEREFLHRLVADFREYPSPWSSRVVHDAQLDPIIELRCR
ncbi:MAG: hypothetical protein AB1673_14630 [Actinomycetota bacterium]|jgi:hypothetical protein